jgi:hypothetical protein
MSHLLQRSKILKTLLEPATVPFTPENDDSQDDDSFTLYRSTPSSPQLEPKEKVEVDWSLELSEAQMLTVAGTTFGYSLRDSMWGVSKSWIANAGRS